MLIGYARVSTTDQTLALQQGALKRAGCERIFTDAASGSRTDRTGLEEALRFLRDGEDTLVVWRLDRLGRSLRHLIDTISELQERGVGFRSLQEQIDTTTSGGKLVFHVFAALTEFARELVRERTLTGLSAARAGGRPGGRPTVMTPDKLRAARKMYQDVRSVGTHRRADRHRARRQPHLGLTAGSTTRCPRHRPYPAREAPTDHQRVNHHRTAARHTALPQLFPVSKRPQQCARRADTNRRSRSVIIPTLIVAN